LKAARGAADRMAEHLSRKFGLQGKWDGDVLSFERPGVVGALEVSAKDLHLTISLGFLLAAMRGSIEAAIVKELDSLFAKSKKAPAPKKKGG
jgi:putative polyhydroxyalkanoate system protein